LRIVKLYMLEQLTALAVIVAEPHGYRDDERTSDSALLMFATELDGLPAARVRSAPQVGTQKKPLQSCVRARTGH